MGLLDDLRNQAEGKKAADEEAAARKAEREQYYQEKTLPRMIKAYQFFNEFVEHLNYIKLETIAYYPLLPNGGPQPLRQEGYNVVIDSSKALKRIDFSMEGVLDTPLQFEIFGKDAVQKHADRIERYGFRHERKDRKDPASMELIGAKFILQGPLPLKVTIEADVDAKRINMTIRNFKEPGFTKYNLTVEQFSDEFLDQLGKFVLRKEDRLFGKSEELSEEAKKKLRDRMIVEARIREQEMIEAEERRKAEEAAEKERTAKEQIKRVVNTQKEQLKRVMNTQVAKGKESLKGMFDKLKKQVQVPQQTSPVQSTPQTTPPASIPPTKPAQTHQQVTAKTVMSAQTNTPATVIPPVSEPTAEQVRELAISAKRQTLEPITARAPTQATSASPASIKTASQPAVVANSNSASPPSPVAVQTATVKKSQTPKVYNAPPNNPFLKREPPVEPPVDAAEQEAKTPTEKPEVDATPVADSSSRLELTPESLEEDLARIIEREKQNTPQQTPDSKTTTNPFLQTSSTKVAAQTATAPAAIERPRPYLKPSELNTSLSDVLPITRQAVSAKDTTAPEAKNTTQNPISQPDDLELDIDVSGNVVPPQNNDSNEKS
jgi:hypothetical protein